MKIVGIFAGDVQADMDRGKIENEEDEVILAEIARADEQPNPPTDELLLAAVGNYAGNWPGRSKPTPLWLRVVSRIACPAEGDFGGALEARPTLCCVQRPGRAGQQMRAGVAPGGPEAAISPHSPPNVIRDVAVGLPDVQGGEEEAQGEVPLPYHAPE